MNQKKSNTTLTDLLPGLIPIFVLSLLAFFIAELPVLKKAAISPLIIGILLGIVPANLKPDLIKPTMKPGLQFSTSRLLRIGVALYGFKITLQELSHTGLPGLVVSVLMVLSTFFLGTFVAVRFFKIDRDTAILTAAGSSICGAAAVLAMESMLKADSYKSAVAVSTVVLFGTISMFLYPALYNAGLIPFDEFSMGIYTGGTVHEVAHVVGAGNAIGQIASDNAIIVKMTRVLLLLPMLLGTGWFLNRQTESGSRSKLPVPWFAVAFMGVVIFHSFVELPSILMQGIHTIDTLFLTMAMTALGLGTTWEKVKKAGPAPLLVAGIMFAWLMVGGFFITASSLSFCIENCPVTH